MLRAPNRLQHLSMQSQVFLAAPSLQGKMASTCVERSRKRKYTMQSNHEGEGICLDRPRKTSAEAMLMSQGSNMDQSPWHASDRESANGVAVEKMAAPSEYVADEWRVTCGRKDGHWRASVIMLCLFCKTPASERPKDGQGIKSWGCAARRDGR